MTENSTPTFRDLTLVEAWRLIKRFFSAVLVCALVLILPYVLLTLGSKGVDTMVSGKGISTKWIGYLLSFVVLLFVVFHINDLFSSLAELFANLANLTKAMPWLKRTAFAILLVSYFLGWIHFPIITFFVSALVLIPAGFAYDEYTRLLRDKQSAGQNA